MSKNKRKTSKALKKNTQKRKRRAKERLPQTKSSNKQEWLKKLGKVSLIFLTLLGVLLGGISAYFLFYPLVSIKAGQTTDFHNPFKTRFLISNDGYFSFYDLKYEAYYGKVVGRMSENSQPILFARNLSKPPQIKVGELPAHKSHTIKIEQVEIPIIDTADVLIKIYFTTKVLFFSKCQTDSVRFVSERYANNEYMWHEDYSYQLNPN